MKKILLAILLFSSLVSCNSNEGRLKKQISELEAENKKLKETLDNKKTQEIVDLQLLLSSKTNKMQLNKENKITGKFVRYEQMPKYNLYIMDNATNLKTLVAENLTNPDFEFEFKPKSEKEHLLNVIAEIKVGGKKIKQFGRYSYTFEK